MNNFSIPIRIYIEDTDAGGIVYYVNYLKYMERARTELFRSLGYDKPAILDDGLLLVVHAANVNYHRSARLDDQVNVTACIEKLARTYVELQQRVFRENELLCEGHIRIACIKADTMKPCALPAEIHHQLTQFIQTQSFKS